MEEEESSDDDDEEEQVPYSEARVQEKDVTSGRYFKDLVNLPLTELQNHVTSKSAFAKAMEYPLKGLKKICSKLTLDDIPIEVHPWPGDMC